MQALEPSPRTLADTPGMTANDINVELGPDGQTLVITGEKKQEHKTEKKDKQVRRNRFYVVSRRRSMLS
jgi:HSP20 family molecular chaperone IbpA